jgi:hypothetical protein
MEAVFVIIPIAITLVSTIAFACQYTRINNRIVSLEQTVLSMTVYMNTPRQQYQIAPQPSAPPAPLPGYGYQYYPGNPSIV